jgi:phage shock protein E
VTEAQARALVKDGARLVDVRTPEEFAAGHMEGAINLPLDTLQARATAELAPREAPVVLYCRSGRRSAKAAVLLGELGFTQVHDLGPMPTGTPH